jgi:ornithine cyclodeaminase/alanine dehydrogenase-like protein (mu-crystallin family)
VQGQAHLQLLPRVRGITEIRVASRRAPDAEALAATDSRARAVGSVREAVRDADIVCLCTSSATPVIEASWLAPGAHVTSVGYAPPGGELPADVVHHATLAVESRLSFSPPPGGCAELAGLDPTRGRELGELLSGRAPGRSSPTELTAYKSMGHAMEDLVVAEHVYRRARDQGVGQMVHL